MKRERPATRSRKPSEYWSDFRRPEKYVNKYGGLHGGRTKAAGSITSGKISPEGGSLRLVSAEDFYFGTKEKKERRGGHGDV